MLCDTLASAETGAVFGDAIHCLVSFGRHAVVFVVDTSSLLWFVPSLRSTTYPAGVPTVPLQYYAVIL